MRVGQEGDIIEWCGWSVVIAAWQAGPRRTTHCAELAWGRDNGFVGFGDEFQNAIHKLNAADRILLRGESACQGGAEVTADDVRLISRIDTGDLALEIGLRCELSRHRLGHDSFVQTFAQ